MLKLNRRKATQKLLINSSASKAIAIGEKPLPDQNGQVSGRSEISSNQQNECGRRLVWFRTLAFQANDPGFKSRRPHQFTSIRYRLAPFFNRMGMLKAHFLLSQLAIELGLLL
jgi:hypothetical protein